MQALRGTIEGPFVVDDDFDVEGTIAGDVTVRPGHTLRFRGNITGDLTVEKGATAIIYGTIDGRIRKLGGTVAINHGEAG